MEGLVGLAREGSLRRQDHRLAFGGPGWGEWPVAEDHCSFPRLQGGQAEGWVGMQNAHKGLGVVGRLGPSCLATSRQPLGPWERESGLLEGSP